MNSLEYSGLAAAAAVFGNVWFGHAAVRIIEFRSARLWIPQAIFALAGGICLAASLAVSRFLPSLVLGITGTIFVYDSLELSRQARRALGGRAKANPANPRHRAAIAGGRAVTSDPLGHGSPEPTTSALER